jgi:hypothetical protein
MTNTSHSAKQRANSTDLFLASFLALFFELLVLRYLTSEVRAFTNLKNLPLIAAFFGIGLGTMLGANFQRLRRWFPIVALLLFSMIRFATLLHLPAVDISWNYGIDVAAPGVLWRILSTVRFLSLTFFLLALVVFLFTVLGSFIGEQLPSARPVHAYGINLAGSLAGMALFSVLSFFNFGPAVWLLVGFVLLIPFFASQRVALLLFAVTVAVVAIPESGVFWSPYYRIDFAPIVPAGASQPSAYSVVTNHIWHQWAADVSPDFLRRYPEAKPNRYLPEYYGIPYRLVPHPRTVLILGAGTGNDVAAALRNGAEHIDAVELDPLILSLGKRYHPEHPYSSDRVTAHNDDARAFLKKTYRKYDLIVFAFLDSTTLLSGFSSLRLDNYVYTVEGFQNARALLAENGTLVLTFATSRSFATDRLYATLASAFGTPPAAYLTQYWVKGVVMVEGGARATKLPELPDVGEELQAKANRAVLATDAWPFLYLESRSIPASILVVVPLFLLAAWKILQKSHAISKNANAARWHFFFLGAGFLLLETKAITQLSLLFGSTWIVTSLVISSFLLMALLSNAVVTVRSISPWMCYTALLALLLADMILPYSVFNRASFVAKVLMSGLWVAAPVFFSGLIFSGSLKQDGSVSQALGINLFGAVCGGVLENAVMVGGTPVLIRLSLGLYALSALSLAALRRGESNEQASWELP